MYNNFPGYQMPYFNYQSPSAVQLQQEQVTQVNGKASVDQIQLAPNSSKLVMDYGGKSGECIHCQHAPQGLLL